MSDLKESMRTEKRGADQIAEGPGKRMAQANAPAPAATAPDNEATDNEDGKSQPDMTSQEEAEEEDKESTDDDIFQNGFEQKKPPQQQEGQSRWDSLPGRIRTGLVAFEQAVLDTVPTNLRPSSDCN